MNETSFKNLWWGYKHVSGTFFGKNNDLKQFIMDRKEKIQIGLIITVVLSLFIYSFYTHRNEPHWFETKYVKIIK